MNQIEELNIINSQIISLLEQVAKDFSGEVEIFRVAKKLTFIEKRIKLIDEDLVPPNLISEIQLKLKITLEQIVTFEATEDKAAFDRFVSHLNEAVSLFSSLPLLNNDELDNVKHRFSILTAQKLTELENRVQALKTDETKLIDEFKSNWNDLINGSQEKGVSGVKNDLNIEIKKLNDRIDLAFNGTEEHKGWTTLANENIKEIEAIKERAKQLGVLIADGTTSGSYRDQAKQEISAFRAWRFFTVVIAIAWIFTIFSTPLIAFMKPIFWKIFEIELDVPTTFTGVDLIYSRLLNSLPFIAIAAWTSSIASNHRKAAIRLKQFEMDLAAFEPSLENVGDPERSAAKLEFVKTTFGKNHDVVDPSTAELLKKVIDKLGDATNKLAEKLKV